jgi:hypothetical protein
MYHAGDQRFAGHTYASIIVELDAAKRRLLAGSLLALYRGEGGAARGGNLRAAER